MEYKDIIQKYGGERLSMEGMSAYERWALGFFHNKDYLSDPNVSFTLQPDITGAKKRYEGEFKSGDKTSFTAYLVWTLIQAIKEHPTCSYRVLDGTWYQFANLPLTFPVSTNSSERFQEILIESVTKMGWEEFCEEYGRRVGEAIAKPSDFKPIDNKIWNVAYFIGNLPNIQFTSLNLHAQVSSFGRPYFYFGKRYEAAGRLMVPLHVTIDHSNMDPRILGDLLDDFKRISS